MSGSRSNGSSSGSSSSDGSANTEVASFVWTVYNDMDDLITMREPLLMPPQLDASVEDRARLAQFVGMISEAWPNVFGTREEVVNAVLGLSDAQLAAVGLTGKELQTKLLIWRRARYMLDQAFATDGLDPIPAIDGDNVAPPAGVKPENRLRKFLKLKKGKPVCKWTNRVLVHADTLLGSLGKLMIGERLTEVKQTVEKLTGELAEDLP